MKMMTKMMVMMMKMIMKMNNYIDEIWWCL